MTANKNKTNLNSLKNENFYTFYKYFGASIRFFYILKNSKRIYAAYVIRFSYIHDFDFFF